MNFADYYPAHQRAEIDAINDRIYRDVNNGVYRAGFAITQVFLQLKSRTSSSKLSTSI